jgi:hypothetical protein
VARLFVRRDGRKPQYEETVMAVRCSVSTDKEQEELELDFVELPRTGEAVDVSGVDGVETFRVTRVVHRVGAPASPSILLEVTSKIL